MKFQLRFKANGEGRERHYYTSDVGSLEEGVAELMARTPEAHIFGYTRLRPSRGGGGGGRGPRSASGRPWGDAPFFSS